MATPGRTTFGVTLHKVKSPGSFANAQEEKYWLRMTNIGSGKQVFAEGDNDSVQGDHSNARYNNNSFRGMPAR